MIEFIFEGTFGIDVLVEMLFRVGDRNFCAFYGVGNAF
jgi:hypothetical protein